MTIVHVGHDWAEDHHDIYFEDIDGRKLHADASPTVSMVSQRSIQVVAATSPPLERFRRGHNRAS